MSKIKKFFTARRMCAMAVLIAIQVILARFVGWQISEGLRISFETIPVIIAGVWLGPVAGLVVGLLSDILGTIISGYGVYFIPLSVTPILNGVLPGLWFRYIWKEKLTLPRTAIMIFSTEIVASLLLGTAALVWYYDLFVPSKTVTYWILFVPRLTKFATMAVDTIVVWILHRSAYKQVIYPMFSNERRK